MASAQLTFESPSGSFLDASFTSIHGFSYTLTTNRSSRQTCLTRAKHVHPFATVHWPTSSMFHSMDPIVAIDGAKIRASEMLISSNVLASSRKFRVPGYADNFKWKKISGGWQCHAPCRTLVASIHSSKSGALRVTLHMELDPSSEQDQILLDSVFLTALLITTHADDLALIPVPSSSSSQHCSPSSSRTRPSVRSRTISSPLPSSSASAQAGATAIPTSPLPNLPLSPVRARNAFDIRRSQLRSTLTLDDDDEGECESEDEEEDENYYVQDDIIDLYVRGDAESDAPQYDEPPPYSRSLSPSPAYIPPPASHSNANTLCPPTRTPGLLSPSNSVKSTGSNRSTNTLRIAN